MIPAVDLVQVDMIRAQPAKAGVDLRHDGLARKAAAVRILAHRTMDLGGDDHLVALGEIAQCPAVDLLARSGRIDIGGVEEVDAQLQRTLNEGPALLLAQGPRMVSPVGLSISHAAKAQARHFQAGPAEIHIVHRRSFQRLSDHPTVNSQMHAALWYNALSAAPAISQTEDHQHGPA